MLPDFVLPYRSVLVEQVERFFDASEEVRLLQSQCERLGRYWKQWCAWFETLGRLCGWPVQRACDALGYWRQLCATAGGGDAAQRRLVGKHELSLLRRYFCHLKPPQLLKRTAQSAAPG